MYVYVCNASVSVSMGSSSKEKVMSQSRFMVRSCNFCSCVTFSSAANGKITDRVFRDYWSSKKWPLTFWMYKFYGNRGNPTYIQSFNPLHVFFFQILLLLFMSRQFFLFLTLPYFSFLFAFVCFFFSFSLSLFRLEKIKDFFNDYYITFFWLIWYIITAINISILHMHVLNRFRSPQNVAESQ